MRRALTVWKVFGYAVLGAAAALVAHELGYGGSHEAGVDHSHVPTVARWLAVPAVVTFATVIRSRPRIRLRWLVAAQFVALAGLEVGERIVQSLPWASLLAPPVLSAVVVGPLVALAVVALTLLPALIERAFASATSVRMALPADDLLPDVPPLSSIRWRSTRFSRGPPVRFTPCM